MMMIGLKEQDLVLDRAWMLDPILAAVPICSGETLLICRESPQGVLVHAPLEELEEEGFSEEKSAEKIVLGDALHHYIFAYMEGNRHD